MKHKKEWYYILGIVFILVIWIALSYIYDNSIVIPKVSVVAKALFEMLKTADIYVLVFFTILKIFLTVIISTMIGIILGFISYKSKSFGYFIKPLITIFKTTPVIVIIILLFMMIGVKATPYIITCFVVIPIIYESVLLGLVEINTDIKDEIKMVSSINLTVLKEVYIKMIAPVIITSVIQSTGLGLKVMLMAEYISSSNNSLGSEIRRYYNNNDMSKVFAIAIIVVILVSIIDIILNKVKKKYSKSS